MTLLIWLWLIFSLYNAWRNHQARVQQAAVLDELRAEIRHLAQLITRQQSLELLDAPPEEQAAFLEGYYEQ